MRVWTRCLVGAFPVVLVACGAEPLAPPRPPAPVSTITADQAERSVEGIARDFERGLIAGTLRARLLLDEEGPGRLDCGRSGDTGAEGQVRIEHRYLVTPPVRETKIDSVLAESLAVFRQEGYVMLADERFGGPRRITLSREADGFELDIDGRDGVGIEVSSPCVWPDGRAPGQG